MIIYNVTLNIDNSIHDEWLVWLQQKHIPEVLATGKFASAKLVKVLVDDDGGQTYSVQFIAADKETLLKYYEEDAPRLRQEGLSKFGDKMLSFRTELEVISEH